MHAVLLLAGTHVAGIVGARNNGVGVVGVVPGVPIYSLKVLDGRGAGVWQQRSCC